MANNIQIAIGVARAPFLILAPACVMLGVSAAYYFEGDVNWWRVCLIVIGALMAHISVNALNEYADFTSGLDNLTSKTPFSGGSGTLPAAPEGAKVALYLGVFTLIATILIGVLLAVSAPALWLIGGIGVLIVMTYTPWINKNSLLCLIAPGVGFGLLMVLGTYYALAENISLEVVLVSLIPFFLVNNLLLLNQFPDEEADRQIGRHHIIIAKGKAFASKLYVSGLVLALVVLVGAVLLTEIPSFVLLGAGLFVLAVPLGRGVVNNYERTEKLLPFMGMNVAVTVGTPVLMAIGFFVA